MIKGAIIINGYYRSEAYSHQIARIVQEFTNKGIELNVIENKLCFSVDKDFDIDFAIFLDKDKYLARILERKGVLVFNNSFALEQCDDKIMSLISLYSENTTIFPKTLIAPIKYHTDVNEDYLKVIERQLPYPLIAKQALGSLGDGVKLVENRKELSLIEKEWSTLPHLYQQFINESRGKSYRAYVVGHKVVASMLLENDNDFRSNAKGSRASKVELDNVYLEIAQGISLQLELDFCAVDFCVSQPLVLEVNSNAYFEKIEAITGVNVAGAITEYIIEFLKEIKEK